MPIIRRIFESRMLAAGEFHCEPDDESWRCENWIGTTPHVVFPGTGVLITQGGGDPLVANPNHAIFYAADTSYRRELLSDAGDHCVWVSVDPALLGEVSAEFDPRSEGPVDRLPFSEGPLDGRTYLAQHTLRTRLVSTADDRLAAEEGLLAVLERAVGAGYAARERGVDDPARRPRPGTGRAHGEAVRATKALITRRFRESLTLEEIGHVVHVSPFHLARLFRRYTGTSIHAYRDQVRLRSSLELIRNRSLGLAEIAVVLGYATHGHFTESFRRAFGVPPSSLRERAGPAGRPSRNPEAAGSPGR